MTVRWLPNLPTALDLRGLLRAGGITICTPVDAPIIRTTLQLDGDLINYIDLAALNAALTDGRDAVAIVAQHKDAIALRIASLAGAVTWIGGLPWSIAGLLPLSLWFGTALFRGFDAAGQWRALVLTPVAAAVLRFGARWIVSAIIQHAVRRFGA